MTRIVCPYCFVPFETKEVLMRCTNDAKERRLNENGDEDSFDVCPTEIDKELSDFKGDAIIKRKHVFPIRLTLRERMGWKLIQRRKCPRCGIEAGKFVCPHCHNWLPDAMIEKGSEIISVVGGPGSGKTNYIVALIHQLQKYKSKLGLTVTLQQVYDEKPDEATAAKYNKKKKELFENKNSLAETEVNKHPTPWIIGVKNEKGKEIYLVFYDSAGESFKDPVKMNRDAMYFKESKAVIVLFDTLGIPKIKKILEEKGIKEDREVYDYKEMWNTIMAFAQNNKGLKLTERPYAFVFSKFDTVINNADSLNCTVGDFVDENHKFKNSSFVKDGVVSNEELDRCSDSISKFLHDEEIWNEDSIAYEIEKEWGKNGKFFGVSALGNDMLEITNGCDVVPAKVLDPLVWILLKLGDFGIKSK